MRIRNGNQKFKDCNSKTKEYLKAEATYANSLKWQKFVNDSINL